MKSIIFTIALLLFSLTDMFGAADHYDSGGKLTTVVICVAVILIGVALFLFYLERRISKLEKEVE